jgi:hypothetical protein
MLFDRFIFILFILVNYSWLLLGIVYNSPARILPILTIIFSLLSVIIVTLFQLQIIVQQKKLDFDGKCSTISWSAIHIFICIFFLLDILEYVNILVIFGILGIFLTVVSLTVLTMSCQVIASSSDAWIPHVHLTCICFWVIINYLYVSLPIIMPFMTVLPVVLMLILRFYEYRIELKSICIESVFFLIAIALHIFLDMEQLSAEHFYQMTAVTVVLIIIVLNEFKAITILFTLPFFMIGFIFYYIGCSIFYDKQPTVESLREKYNDFVSIDELILSVDDFEIDDENWDEHLCTNIL